MADDVSNYDLPILSNANEILVQHYIFDFTCDFETKCLTCEAVLFLKPVSANSNCEQCKCGSRNSSVLESKENNFSLQNIDPNFTLILDCNKLIVHEVITLDLLPTEIESLKFSGLRPNSFPKKENLIFSVEKWCLKVWKSNSSCKLCFPRLIKISYKTVPEGLSLLWVQDQDGNPAVFAYGSAINNRSFLPCQETSSAMATWEATICTIKQATVLMSGDNKPQISENSGMQLYYYYTKMILPLSTLCLAIGFWKQKKIPLKIGDPACTLYAPSKLFEKAFHEFANYIPRSIQASTRIIGPFPFSRIDFLIVPRGFGSLGMASPNLIFLSQSLLAGDSIMCSSVAHEIAHSWFGLLIGALDWTEEWLSEGFATFIEDYTHIKAINMPVSDIRDYHNLVSYIRLKMLLYDVGNTDDNLQILRPNKGKTVKGTVDGVEAVLLKNGNNPEKFFSQVHYMKGYFLLQYLSQIIGVEKFMTFLRDYVAQYKGQLVESQVVFKLLYQMFPEIQNTISLNDLMEEWLHTSGVPHELAQMKPYDDNKLYMAVRTETDKWKALNAYFLKKTAKRKKYSLNDCLHLSLEQKLLILDNLIEIKKMAVQTLRCLNEAYTFEAANARLQHKWCELVVKHKYRPGYKYLQTFLKEHLGMGIYFYGELIFSGNKAQKEIALQCYAEVKSEMEPNFVATIEKMLSDAQLHDS